MSIINNEIDICILSLAFPVLYGEGARQGGWGDKQILMCWYNGDES